MTIKTDKTIFIRSILISLIFFMSAHAFCIFNLSLRGESLMLNAEKMNNVFLSAGQFFRPFYLRIRGGIASPMTIGLISFISLSASCILLSHLCGLNDGFSFALLSGLLFFHPAVLEQFAGSLLTADMVFISFFLLIAGSALPFIRPKGFLLSIFLIFLGLALSPHLAITVICVPVLYCAAHPDENPKNHRMPYLLTAAAALIAVVLFALGVFFFSRRSGIMPEMHSSWMNRSLTTILLSPITTLFTPVTIYPHLFPILRFFILAAAGIFLFRQGIISFLSLVVLYLFMVLPSAGAAGQFPFQYYFLDVLFLIFLHSGVRSSLPEKKKVFSVLTAGIYTFLFLGELLFANQGYLKINLDMDTSLSVMTQVIHRLENRQDFIPGQTQTAFIGTLAHSPLVHEREGFEHLSVMDVFAGESSIQTQSQTTWFFWETLGYPMNCLSDYEQEKLAALPEIASAPVFPHPDSIFRVDDTLVVHLSE